MRAAYHASFHCIAGCPGAHPLDEVHYLCPSCGGLLEVAHDLDALAATPAVSWRARFDERAARAGSGVWGFRELVHPTLPEEAIVSLGEGRTHLLPLPRLARELDLGALFVKTCGISATGSFKDLGMTVLVSAVNSMRRAGRPIRAVVCASTGDTSAALAAYAARAEIPSIVLLPRDKIALAQLVQPLAHGSIVLSLDTDFDGCMQIVRELTGDPSLYLANSLNALRLEGQKTVAFEIAQQLGWEVPDFVVVPGGNLGNVAALGRGFELLRGLGLTTRLPRLVCAQAEAADPLYRSAQTGFTKFEPVVAKKTQASAIRIGDPVSYPRAVRALQASDGLVTSASEDALADAAARLDREGAYACPHTGVALAGLLSLREQGVVGPRDRVAIVSTAHGLKFTEFKVGYHERRLPGVESLWANAPVELPAELDTIRAALAART